MSLHEYYAGKTAIITGGASGIGKAIAVELAHRGCELVIADLQLELAQAVAEEIKSTGGKAQALLLDVANYEAFKAVIENTHARLGHLDFLFNNAGFANSGNLEDFSIEDWNRIIDVNLRGVIHGVQSAYPLMIKQGHGHIVNTASMAGLTPGPGMALYCTTKHAVVGLTNALRGEAAIHGVRASVLCPGVIRTAILDGGGKFGKLTSGITEDFQKQSWENLKPMDADLFARKALDEISKNKPLIIVPKWWSMLWAFTRFFPFYSQKVIAKGHADNLQKIKNL
jgi:NAD(P)-dependent dehydrogenase (short-subunit alcohol dehydrogenase family)